MSIEQQVVNTIHDLEIPGYGDDEITFMAATVINADPDFIGDWGTNRGSSARIFYEASRANKNQCRIVTVELPPELEPLDRDHAGIFTGAFVKDLDGVFCTTGDGVTEALTEARFHQAQRPLFFLDGDHQAENVYREITLINRIYPRAFLLLHDTKNIEGHQHGPGFALSWWLSRFPESYGSEHLASQAGMTRLWPNL